MSTSEMANSKIRHTVTTGATREHHVIEWKIENFLIVKSFNTFARTEFRFVTGSSHGTSLRFGCRLKKTTSNNIGLEMFVIDWPRELVSGISHFKYMIMKPNGEVFKSGDGESTQITSQTRYELTGCIPSDTVLTDILWEDGSICIRVALELYLIKPAPLAQPIKVDLKKELKDFERLELRKLSDFMTRTIESDSQPETKKIVKVVSKDKKEFYANTALLSARSPVFLTMFNSENWKEGQGSSGEATLVLEDLSGKTVKVLLHYLIGGVLRKEDWKAEDVILELTWAAGKYQLEGLTEFLDKVLPAIDFNGTEVVAKLALLTSRLGMKNSEEKLFLKLKEKATNIDELVLDKAGSFLGTD